MQTAPAKSSLAHFAPHLAPHVDGPIRVRAIMRGFYGNTLRQPGDVFGIETEAELAPWMERVADEEVRAPEPESEPAAPTRPSRSRKAKQSDDDVL